MAVLVTVAVPAGMLVARTVKAALALEPGATFGNDFVPWLVATCRSAGTVASLRALTVSTTLPATQRLDAVTVVGSAGAIDTVVGVPTATGAMVTLSMFGAYAVAFPRTIGAVPVVSVRGMVRSQKLFHEIV